MDNPDIASELTRVVLGLGFPGVVIVVLAFAVRGLWQEIKTNREQLFQMGIKHAQATEANTAALNRMSDILVRGKEL